MGSLRTMMKSSVRRASLAVVLAAGLAAPRLSAQGTSSHATPAPATPAASTASLDFPVTLQQKVIAGKTPVGAKVQAKLVVATLTQGVVIPENAVFTGEVTESAAKTATSPSRLAIRIDSVQWKSGSQPTVLPLTSKLYLTVWYYPVNMESAQSSGSVIPDASHNPASSRRAYPTAASPSSPFPDKNQGSPGNNPEPSPSTTSILKHREVMRNMDSAAGSDGGVTLTCRRSNIKLDKYTTYVLAATNLQGSK
jgi:hypothetical protein